MKVLLFSTGSGSRGGGEIYLLHLTAGLRELGVTVSLALPAHPRMDELASAAGKYGIALLRLPYRNLYDRRLRTLSAVLDRRQARETTAQLRAVGADLIHLNQQVLEDGLELIAELDRQRLPYVCTTHVAQSPSTLKARAAWLRERCVHSILRRARSHHVAVADAARRELLGWCPYLESRSSVVHNGPIDPALTLATGRRDALRSEWGVVAGDVLFGAVGRLNPQKDPMFLVQAAARLCARHPNARFVWIGDGELRGAMEQAIAAAGLTARFQILGWRDDVADCLTALDVFVLPSRFEGLPLALIEACGAGLPCVVNAVDGIPELVEHQSTGWLCQPGDAPGWDAALSGLLADPGLRQRLGAQARVRALRDFTRKAMAEKTLALYQERLAAR